MGKVFKIFTILISLVLIVAAIGVAMLAFPVFGNQALIVRSGSMEPGIGVGAVVIVRPDANYNVGDIIAFKYDESTIITHRISEVLNSPEGVSYKTKGDANEEEDSWTVPAGDVLGKNYLTLPEFGKVLAFARSEYGFPLLIIFPAVLVMLLEFINIAREIRKNIRKKREEKLSNTFSPNLSGNIYKINPDSYFTKRNFNALKIFIPLFAFSFFIQGTSAFFSDTETSRDNFFQAAETFPTMTPTPTPPGDGQGGNPCDDIDVDISGNGAGSINGVIIICKDFKVVEQTNVTESNTVVNTTTNTGNNSSSGNTSTSTNIQTGSSSSTTTVTHTSGTNTNSD